MKPYLTYGAFIAIGNAAVTLILYLTGFHTNPATLQTGNYIAGAASLVIGISLLVVGTRAKRAAVPASQEFNYGMALGAGVIISLVATILGTAFQFIYQSFINPGFADIVVQAQTMKLQASGMPSEQIEKMKSMMRVMTKPAVQAALGFIGGMVMGAIISLITAAFLKRKAVEPPLA